MATVSKNDKSKKQQTVRERTRASSEAKPPRLRRTAGKVGGPLSKGWAFLKQKFGFIKLPENHFGNILRKIGRILWPNFFREAGREIRQVTWPNRRETMRLTMAVFIFAVVFAVIVGAIDFGLDKLFREVIVGDK